MYNVAGEVPEDIRSLATADIHGLNSGKPTRILVADDSIISRHLLEATLKKWGYDVISVADGAEAWEVLQNGSAPSVAILDWMMPGITGPELCRRVRQQAREPYTYILLLTSRSLKDDVVAGLDSGADDYLTKPFDHHELQVRLRAGARIVELQRQLLSTREAMRQQATRDYLTKLWNRSSILDIFERELSRSARDGNPFGIALLDLDHFKSINDTYGHIAGDKALKEASRRMLTSVRKYDSVGRYGGEEFLVILPGCDDGATQTYAERIRTTMRESPLDLPEATITLSASLGCTSVINRSGLQPESVIRIADDALYQAKARGRNRVVFVPALEHVTSSAG